MKQTKLMNYGLCMLACLAASSALAQTCAQITREARQLASQRQFAEAAQRYSQALALAAKDSDKLQARLGMGVSLVLSGKPAAGRAVLKSLLADMAPTRDARAAALEGVGDSYMRERDYPAAAAAYEAMARTEGANPAYAARGWTKVGNAQFAQGRYHKARAAYEAAVNTARVGAFHLQTAWPRIGDCYRAEGRYAEARAAYLRVAAAKNADAPTKLRAEAAVGHSYYEEGDYPAAAAVYQRVLAKPKPPNVWRIVERVDTICRRQLCKADDMLAAGKAAQAFAEFQKVLTMPWAEEHHKASARLGMGHGLAAQQNWAQARTQYEQVLANKGALWPDRGRAQLGIARCYQGQGNAPAARNAFQKVLTMKNISSADAAEARRRLK